MAKLTNTAKPCSESKIPKRKEKVGEEKKRIYIFMTKKHFLHGHLTFLPGPP